MPVSNNAVHILLGSATLGLIGWLLLRSRRKEGAEGEKAITDSLHTWMETACPACLTRTLLERSGSVVVTERV